jgi:DMSO/TMAO reductase YedYZ molybdopterin-dependent catalytic subunit
MIASAVPVDPHRTSRREFLTRCLAAAVAPVALTQGRLAGTRPLLGTNPPPPFNRLLGRGLDARQFFDLSTLTPRTRVVPTEEFYVRTETPLSLPRPPWVIAISRGRTSRLDLAALREREVDMGEVLVECAGNNDPSNFGLIGAATWTGVPIETLLEAAAPAGARRLVISGLDAHPPSRTSVPGASWNCAADDLRQSGAFLATAMNGEPLTAVHGAPVRLVVPGWYGCAAIKWVSAIDFVGDDEPPTSQMREFALRTFQDGVPPLARDYRPPAIEHSATPIRVEQWVGAAGVSYRVIGILWGGARPTNRLSIRFHRDDAWVPVESCPLPTTTRSWTLWSHTWRPAAPGRYRIALRVDEPAATTARLDMFFYLREVEIEEV